jgi:hypothetical protein
VVLESIGREMGNAQQLGLDYSVDLQFSELLQQANSESAWLSLTFWQVSYIKNFHSEIKGWYGSQRTNWSPDGSKRNIRWWRHW